jgi:hypothetical protein
MLGSRAEARTGYYADIHLYTVESLVIDESLSMKPQSFVNCESVRQLPGKNSETLILTMKQVNQ